MEAGNFFTLEYYFDIYPQASALSIFIAIYFIALLAVRPYLRMLASRHAESKLLRKLQRKHLSRLATIGILGILTIGARNLAIPLLGMRAIAYGLMLWSFYEIWAVSVVHRKKVHEITASIKARTTTDKYLPKPKRTARKK